MEEGISLFWNIIFVLALSQGVFFGVILLTQYFRNRLKSQIFLSIFILVFSYILLHNLIYWNQLLYTFPEFLFTTMSPRYLLAPFFYFYFKTFTKDQFSIRDLVHFLPFLIATYLIYPLLFQSGSTRMEYWEIAGSEITQQYIQIFKGINWVLAIQLILYPAFILWSINQFSRKEFEDDPDKQKQFSWLKFLTILFLVYGVLMLLYFILLQFGIGGIQKDYYISLIMCIAVYGISYVGVINPVLLKGEEFLKKINVLKYKTTKLEEDYLESLVEKIDQFMYQEQAFLDADFSLTQLAEKAKIPRHHISQALNQKLQKSFTDYVNAHRIDHAIKLLSNGLQDTNIKTVMYASGFNNRVSFNNNFKKITGKTASEFLKNIRSN